MFKAKYLGYVVSMAAALFTSVSYADIKFSGYGSLVAGKTLGTVDDPLNPGQTRDETFTADFYDVGQYTNDLTFNAESMIALQATTSLGEQLDFTAQLVAKGTDDFSPEFDWYYLTYKPSEQWTILAGRRNIPMYYFSEFSEVGFAYPWMRPPSNLYWWQVTQFNGVSAIYDFTLGDYASNVMVFYGNEYSYDNKEMKYYDRLYGGNARSVDEFWKDILGFNWNVSGDNFDVRLVYFTNDRDRTTVNADGTSTDSPHFTQEFLGFGGSVNFNPITVLFDWNLVKYDDAYGTEFPTYLVSVVYNIDKFQPYISYSKADHKRKKVPTDDLEEHYLLSYGLRYNFYPSAALKIQYDNFVDQGDKATGWAYHGDSRAVSIGVDFIF
ncbi:hypothetical protein [Pseudoalteromonas xiamenensis]